LFKSTIHIKLKSSNLIYLPVAKTKARQREKKKEGLQFCEKSITRQCSEMQNLDFKKFQVTAILP